MKYQPKRGGYKFTPEIISYIKEQASNNTNNQLSKLVYSRFGVLFTSTQINRAKWRHQITGKGLQGGQNRKTLFSKKVKNGFILIKVNNKEWKRKHHFIWEQANGKIPKGYNVIFLDNNNLNFELDNLALVTTNEMLKLTQFGLWTNDQELTKLGLAIVRHNTAIHTKLLQSLGKQESRSYLRKIYKERNKQRSTVIH